MVYVDSQVAFFQQAFTIDNLHTLAGFHYGIVLRQQKVYMLPVLRLVYDIGILDSLAVQEKFLFIRKKYKTIWRRKAF